MVKLVLIRHGQSEWNLSNLFTGWTDVHLSEQGVKEAHEAGKLLKEKGYSFDIAFSSVLERANKTMEYALKELGEWDSVPKFYSWRLNERHYGALQGLNKAESAKKWGDEQVHIWRRSADVPPLALTRDDERWPGNQPLYKDLVAKGEMTIDECPLTECLIDTAARVKPYFDKEIWVRRSVFCRRCRDCNTKGVMSEWIMQSLHLWKGLLRKHVRLRATGLRQNGRTVPSAVSK